MVTKRPHPTHCASRGRKAAPIVIAALALAGAALAGRVRRVEVAGVSMVPALAPGERLLVVGPWPIRPGQVVAVTDPGDPGRSMVKRVRSVSPAGVDVRGDNPAASTDSRHFGPLPRRAVWGRVVYRYHPPGQAGWWPGRMP